MDRRSAGCEENEEVKVVTFFAEFATSEANLDGDDGAATTGENIDEPSRTTS